MSETNSPPKNYITPTGFRKLKDELHQLLNQTRPEVANVVAWAASNGDRSENADYQYGKKRLREIDRRIRFLTKRLEIAEVVDPIQVSTAQKNSDQIRFGATVLLQKEDDTQKSVTIVGVDETEPALGQISWISPLGKALLGKRIGDLITFHTPRGPEEVEVLEIQYAGNDSIRRD